MSSLRLEDRPAIDRPLSSSEYAHAAPGSSDSTLEPARIIHMVLEGESTVSSAQWATALRAVAQVNPGLRLRVVGQRQRSRWSAEGVALPEVRRVSDCVWDGKSHHHMHAIERNALPLQTGPGLELVVYGGPITRVILRVRHALMDGGGVTFFFEELFRALRGEPLLGTNASFSDVDLMRAVVGKHSPWGWGTPIALTGGAQGTSKGDVWQRLTLPAGSYPNLLGRVADVAARYARTFQAGLVRVAVPADLRRHVPGLRSTMNHTGMLYVELAPEEGAEDFRRKLRQRLADKGDAAYIRLLDNVRYLPLTWIDRLTGRTPRNYLRRRLVETLMITNLGPVSPEALSCPGFRASNYYALPVVGNSIVLISSCGAHLNLVMGMPAVYATGGRLERFADLLRLELTGRTVPVGADDSGQAEAHARSADAPVYSSAR